MGAHLWVQVRLRVGQTEQREAQLREGDRTSEGNANRDPTDKNRVEVSVKQDERATSRKGLVAKSWVA